MASTRIGRTKFTFWFAVRRKCGRLATRLRQSTARPKIAWAKPRRGANFAAAGSHARAQVIANANGISESNSWHGRSGKLLSTNYDRDENGVYEKVSV